MIINILKRHKKRVFASTIWILVAVIILLYLNSIGFDRERFSMDLEGWLISWYGIVVYILIYMVRPFIFAPATVITVVGGSVYGFWLGLIFTIIASNLSASVAYLLGKTVFSNKKFDLKKSDPESLKSRLDNNTFEAVLTARLAFVPFDLVSYIAGSVNANFLKFILGTALGSLPGTIAFVSFGASLTDITNFDDFEFNPRFFILSIVLFVLSFGISRYIRR
jgi:uncharacterized membrane protein YdjX (TVP38/TMEM64 family)